MTLFPRLPALALGLSVSVTLASAALVAGAAAPPGLPAQTDAQRAELAEMRARQARLPDTPGTGSYAALKEEAPSLPEHVVYRPARLETLGATKLGLYVFGNGACVNDGASARLHLLEVASHGYLAIAPGRVRSGPGVAVPDAAPSPQPRTSYTDLTSAIDWALAQNADAKSPYFNRLDPRAIAVSGYSCGGVQALRVAGDPRVRTVVVMNSGILNEPSAVPIPEMNATKDLLKTLHTPTLYLLGGETDIAYANGADDFRRIDHVPVVFANLRGVGHGGSYWEPNGGKAAAAVVAWLDWQLRGDAVAARMFTGKDCGLCRDAAWTVDRKGLQ
jgi:dienelactone hydrolase